MGRGDDATASAGSAEMQPATYTSTLSPARPTGEGKGSLDARNDRGPNSCEFV